MGGGSILNIGYEIGYIFIRKFRKVIHHRRLVDFPNCAGAGMTLFNGTLAVPNKIVQILLRILLPSSQRYAQSWPGQVIAHVLGVTTGAIGHEQLLAVHLGIRVIDRR